MLARNCIKLFRIAGIGTYATAVAMAQGLCIPDPLTSTAIRGHVYFEAGGKKEALADVVMELAPYGYDRPVVKKVVTDSKGWFEMLSVRPGRYYLSAKHEAVIGLRVEIRFKRAKRSGGGDEGLEFVLRNDPSKACGGATVGLASQQARAPSNSAAQVVPVEFTVKRWGVETGLDYFGARCLCGPRALRLRHRDPRHEEPARKNVTVTDACPQAARASEPARPGHPTPAWQLVGI
jgi:hypothetical protein